MSGTNKCAHLPTTPCEFRINFFFFFKKVPVKKKHENFIITSIYYLFFGKLFNFNAQSKVDSVVCMHVIGGCLPSRL